MTDAHIERLLLAAGHKPYTHLSSNTVRVFANMLVAECVDACRGIEARYPLAPSIKGPWLRAEYVDPEAHVARTAAGNCIRAIESRFEDEP